MTGLALTVLKEWHITNVAVDNTRKGQIMDRRFADLREHLKLADEHEKTSSEHNWAAAELVWEMVEDGIKQTEIASEIGKSQAHVTRLKKCWDLRVVQSGLEDFSYSSLGSFYQFYNSPEVHGESSRGNEPGSGSGSDRKERGDYSTSGLVFRASSAVDALFRNREHWKALTEDDIARMEEIQARIRRILRQARLRSV